MSPRAWYGNGKPQRRRTTQQQEFWIRGMSAYVEALIQRQLEPDRLRELIEDAEAEHGSVDQAAVDAKRALLRGDAAGSADAS
ncbi:hypothetical protein [Streptomyces europaeiscabiei]|uniref:hypothetical protein n=2 Tax=Streptomyces europaeiscabiei TaxID=146819 RepID=UPI0013C4A3D3|nr:hypothetical protein [Streptomyces europaeiscabiei]